MIRLSFIILFCLALITRLNSQCCAGCNPIGGNTNLGTLPKYTLQLNTFYRYAYSSGYMENDHASDFRFVKNANSNYVGLQAGYGITKRFTAAIETGYYINRTQNIDISNFKYTLNGYGLSSFNISGRYNIIKDTVHEFEFTAGVGVRVPSTTAPMVVDGVELSEDVQPCNGAYGLIIQSFLFKEFDALKIRVFMMNSININRQNPKEYKEGNTYLNSLFISKTLFKNFSGIFQVRNEIRDYCYRHNILVPSSGGLRFVFIPQLNYSVKQKYNFSVLYELPFYQNYNGVQLKDIYAFSVNLNIRLGLSKKASAVCKKPN
jgi:hypothetical protein